MTFTAKHSRETDALAWHLRRVGKLSLKTIGDTLALGPEATVQAIRRGDRMCEAERRSALFTQQEMPV